MSNQYDITRHIDYVNHMKNYISKVEAKTVIDNLKSQLVNRPIQAHPDYDALMRSISEKHQRDLSRLEQQLRKKFNTPAPSTPIQQHPEYANLVAYYENKIQAASKSSQYRDSSKSQSFKCPACPSCPSCEPAPRCAPAPTPRCPPAPKCPECTMEYSLTQGIRDALTQDPSAYNDYSSRGVLSSLFN